MNQTTQNTTDSNEQGEALREWDHFSIVPFKAICGADVPNQSTTQTPERAKCDTCRFYWNEWSSMRAGQQAFSRASVAAVEGDALHVLMDLRGHFGPSNCWCDAEGDAPHLYCCAAAHELCDRLTTSSVSPTKLESEQRYAPWILRAAERAAAIQHDSPAERYRTTAQIIKYELDRYELIRAANVPADSRGNYTDGFRDGWKAHFDTTKTDAVPPVTPSAAAMRAATLPETPVTRDVASLAEAMMYCGPLREFNGGTTTYIFGFDLTKAIAIITRHLPQPTRIDLGQGQVRARLEELTNKVVVNLVTIRENKIPLATDWAWSELHNAVQELSRFLFAAAATTSPETPVGSEAEACMVASEEVLAREWNTPEEDETWARLTSPVAEGEVPCCGCRNQTDIGLLLCPTCVDASIAESVAAALRTPVEGK